MNSVADGPHPRELILASAGSGKTFLLSSRFIRLLALGESPSSVLGATFTRKAAGEILERIFLRLARAAQDDAGARRLEGEVDLPDGAPPLNRERASSMLRALVRELPALTVGTLDSFFVRTARSFGHELGLPAGWGLVDEEEDREIHRDVIHRLLSEGEVERIGELATLLAGGEARRSVHEVLAEGLQSLQGLNREVDRGRSPEGAPDPWRYLEEEKRGRPRSRQELGALRARLEEMELPLTKAGTPRAAWRKAVDRVKELVDEGAWGDLLELTLTRRMADPEGTFDGQSPSEDLRSVLSELGEHAAALYQRRMVDAVRAMAELAQGFETVDTRVRRSRGGYRFDDVGHLLAGASLAHDAAHVLFRIDARVRHLLLDEFQDTSRLQWEALAPLVDEVLAWADGSRGVLVVADPKQSIYGWRGAEPNLVRAVGERYGLSTGLPLAVSWRSAPEVLAAVNQVFQGVDATGGLEEAERSAAREWLADFEPHSARWKEQPGHVRLRMAPEGAGHDPGAEGDEEAEEVGDVARHAALQVLELRREWARTLGADAPLPEIGVLVRRNSTVTRMIFELGRLSIPASEEGGNPLVDSAPVVSLLALLRLADHPGDTAARYLVAHSAVGDEVGYTDWRDPEAAARIGARVRHLLLRDGYGPTLDRWVGRLADRATRRDRGRLGQLVEMAFTHDASTGLRPGDFVRRIRGTRVEDPTSAPVRVMTIHQSKGLEFDAVILPELGQSLRRPPREPAVPLRQGATGPLRGIIPRVPKDRRHALPGAPEAASAERAARFRDDLSALYVAMTRARHALHLVLGPDEGDPAGKGLTWARILREGLCDGASAAPGETLHESGDPGWVEEWAAARQRETQGAPSWTAGPDAREPRRSTVPDALRDTGAAAGRNVPHRAASELGEGTVVDLRETLRLDREGVDLGTLVHAWCQEVEWIEDGLPDAHRLRAVAKRHGRPAGPELDSLIGRFREWVQDPEVQEALSRNCLHPTESDELRLERELPFALRTREDGREEVVRGILDRVVVAHRDGRPVAARILDFKTDALAPPDSPEAHRKLEERSAHHAPQLEAYRGAVARMYGLEPDAVRASLIFLRAGSVPEL